MSTKIYEAYKFNGSTDEMLDLVRDIRKKQIQH